MSKYMKMAAIMAHFIEHNSHTHVYYNPLKNTLVFGLEIFSFAL